MEITNTFIETNFRRRLPALNVTMATTGDELADLKTAAAAAKAVNATATWVGNDYAATGETATFTFEVR